MRFNDLPHLVAFLGKGYGTPPASGFVSATKMPDSSALSRSSTSFTLYIPLSGDHTPVTRPKFQNSRPPTPTG